MWINVHQDARHLYWGISARKCNTKHWGISRIMNYVITLHNNNKYGRRSVIFNSNVSTRRHLVIFLILIWKTHQQFEKMNSSQCVIFPLISKYKQIKVNIRASHEFIRINAYKLADKYLPTNTAIKKSFYTLK